MFLPICSVQISQKILNQLLGLKEAFQVPHLPDPRDDEDEGLSDGPPEDALVGALAGHAEPLLPVLQKQKAAGEQLQLLQTSAASLTHPLVVLLLLDLLHLVQQLPHSQLQLRQLVLCSDFRVVVGVFSNLDVQMDPLQHSGGGADLGNSCFMYQ